MFLGRYDYDGDPSELAAAYDRMMADIPGEAVPFHACVTHAEGLSVFDCCPSREVFEQFSTSPEFLGMMQTANLPAPRITLIGDVHVAGTGDRLIASPL